MHKPPQFTKIVPFQFLLNQTLCCKINYNRQENIDRKWILLFACDSRFGNLRKFQLRFYWKVVNHINEPLYILLIKSDCSVRSMARFWIVSHGGTYRLWVFDVMSWTGRLHGTSVDISVLQWNISTAVSRKVVGKKRKSARDSPERCINCK